MTSRNPPQVDVEQLLGDTDDEIVIGAYARRVRRQRILTGAVGAALILAAIAAYSVSRPADAVHPDDGYQTRLRCLECGGESTRVVAFDQQFPIRCPHCDSGALAPLWHCYACGTEFADARTKDVHCPACDSTRCGAAPRPNTGQ